MFHAFFPECIPACPNTQAGLCVVKIAYFQKDFLSPFLFLYELSAILDF
jgi:hypothetical protein